MSFTARPSRPLDVWKDLPAELREKAALAFFADDQALAEQAEVIGVIARRINFRPRSVLVMPRERKAAHLARMNDVTDSVASRLLVAYHLAHQRPMMGAFLDRLGIAHEDGLISDEELEAPEPAALREAAATLAATWPIDDVRLYFVTLSLQDPETWSALERVLDDHRDEAGAAERE